MDPPDKHKGTHGGARQGAGRPRNPNKVAKAPIRRFGEPLRTAGGASTSQTSTSAFFTPYNTNRPVPLGNGTNPSAQPATGNRASFWSDVWPSQPASGSNPINPAAGGMNPPSTLGIPLPQFSQLNQELNFVAEDDEHADIAAGDRIIDESLVGEVLENTDTAAAETAEAETQFSEASRDSALQKYLAGVKNRICAEIEASEDNMPLCYVRGDFFDRPPHPVFALHAEMAGTGLKPDQLYSRKVFIWLPHLLPGPREFKCTCGMLLTRNGYNDDPIARRVRNMPADFFLLTNRFICDARRASSPGCNANFQGTDTHIMAQLPLFVQTAFPAYISARGAISKLMMWQMCNTFATRFGPAPFSGLVSEVQYRSHAEWELMYIAAAHFYGKVNIEQFSAFGDRDGYAGSPPSVPYLKALFTDIISAHRIYIERDISTLPLTFAKGDHTFAFLKYMGGLKGENIFTAAYTILNEFEEVRAHQLTLTKSMHFLVDMFKGVQQGLRDSNNPPTQILYTDSPQSERSFHESINSSLAKDIMPVTNYTDLPRFVVAPDVATIIMSDSMDIEAAANDVLQDILSITASSQLDFVALSVKVEQTPGEAPRLDVIQLRTRRQVYIFKVTDLTSRSDILPSLRAILTNPSTIKIGHSIRQTLQRISDTFFLPEIKEVLRSLNPPLLDLGKYTKLKGVVNDLSVSLHALTGIVLQNSFSTPEPALYPWSSPNSEQVRFLFEEIECQWRIYLALAQHDSLGLPLQPSQAGKHGQLVTILQACKPVAEGSIIGHHSGHLDVIMDVQGHTKKINVSDSRSLVAISKVLVPGAILPLHKQTMEWIFSHGEQAVVTTSQLRSRGFVPPVHVEAAHRAFATPAPVLPSDSEAEFSISYSEDFSSGDMYMLSEDEDNDSDEDDDDGDPDNIPADVHGQSSFQVQLDPNAMEGLEFHGPSVDEHSSTQTLLDGIGQAWSFIQQATEAAASNSEALPSRVLDDAFHYMDRLLRLLSKKHSAFKAFAHDFSEAIFIRDKSDELAVRAVLEKNGVSWEYAKRAKAAALNRRIRRHIPGRKILLKRVETLFNAYSKFWCSTKKTSSPFFSDEAKEMCKNLLETVRNGYLSDPAGIPLYYLMGTDRDGLNIYRTVRGTNSVEGGFHMAIRRVFGSLRASPELAECLLVNWILRRNKMVGFHNRTGAKYRGHFDVWIRDEIVELALAIGLKPSFPLPRVLSTRIATSETIGILPISQSLAAELNITTLPRLRITGVPHHRDTPVHVLTRLSTKPTNQYRYLQMRQLVLAAVVPVHTHKEYSTFKELINHSKFRKGGKTHPPREHHKNIDFLKFAQFWNTQVDVQPRTITDSNLRLYYKLPQQLEAHHKKTILWTSERSTLAAGSNFEARKALLDILNSDDNHVDVLPAIPLPDGQPDHSIQSSDHAISFDRMAEAVTLLDEFTDDPLPNAPSFVFHHTTPAIQSIPTAAIQPSTSYLPRAQQSTAQSLGVDPQWQTLLPGALEPGSRRPSAPRRCALCVKNMCRKRLECQGKGGQKFCRCHHPPLAHGEKPNISEEVIIAHLAQQGTSRPL